MTESKLISLFPDVDQELLFEVYNERAAVREYDGGFDRQTAESLAIEDLHHLFD